MIAGPGGVNPYAHRIKESPKAEDMALKSFSAWKWGGESPDDNWGLDYEVPPWVQDVHNKYSGRCFLMGTGPSLASQVHLMPKLSNEYLFTCNRMRLWK